MTIDDIIDIGLLLQGLQKNEDPERHLDLDRSSKLKEISLKLDMYDPVGEKDDTVEIGVSNLKKQLEDITLKDKREEYLKDEETHEVVNFRIKAYLGYKELESIGRGIPIPKILLDTSEEVLKLDEKFPDELFDKDSVELLKKYRTVK